jgi:hypothetical protein
LHQKACRRVNALRLSPFVVAFILEGVITIYGARTPSKPLRVASSQGSSRVGVRQYAKQSTPLSVRVDAHTSTLAHCPPAVGMSISLLTLGLPFGGKASAEGVSRARATRAQQEGD